MGKKETIEKVLKISGAIVRTVIGVGAAALVFFGLKTKRRK